MSLNDTKNEEKITQIVNNNIEVCFGHRYRASTPVIFSCSSQKGRGRKGVKWTYANNKSKVYQMSETLSTSFSERSCIPIHTCKCGLSI